MHRRFLIIGAAMAFISAGPSRAADWAVPKKLAHAGVARGLGGCRDVWRCGPTGCGTWHICARSCPDRYSCFSLYGAYGPYGGAGYWAAYTSGGWGNRW